MNGAPLPSHLHSELAKLPAWTCPSQTQPLMLAVATSLVEAGFTLRHGDAREPGGGPRVDPREHGRGVVVTWITHDTLEHDQDRADQAQVVADLMHFALGDVLTALGWRVHQSRTSLANIVTGRSPTPANQRRHLLEERLDA